MPPKCLCMYVRISVHACTQVCMYECMCVCMDVVTSLDSSLVRASAFGLEDPDSRLSRVRLKVLTVGAVSASPGAQ